MATIMNDIVIWKNKCGEHQDYEDFEKKEVHHVFVQGSLRDPQGYFAWERYKNAKGVFASLRETFTIGDKVYEIYEVTVTHKSAAERFEEDAYGIDHNWDE